MHGSRYRPLRLNPSHGAPPARAFKTRSSTLAVTPMCEAPALITVVGGETPDASILARSIFAQREKTAGRTLLGAAEIATDTDCTQVLNWWQENGARNYTSYLRNVASRNSREDGPHGERKEAG